MPKTSIGPEAKLIQLFDLLPDESKRTVRDILNAKQSTPRTQEAKAPRASKKGLPPPPAKETAEKETKPTKAKKCDVCYEEKDNPIHDALSGYSGYHEFDPGKS